MYMKCRIIGKWSKRDDYVTVSGIKHKIGGVKN